MSIPVFKGFVTDDATLVLEASESDRRKRWLKSLRNSVVYETVKRRRSTRSERANNYYWGQVATPIAKDQEMTAEDFHDAMCERFLPNERKRVEFFNRMTGEALTVETDGRRSSKLTGTEFYDFVENVRLFGLEFLGVFTEDPDSEYWRKRVEKAEPVKGRAA